MAAARRPFALTCRDERSARVAERERERGRSAAGLYMAAQYRAGLHSTPEVSFFFFRDAIWRPRYGGCMRGVQHRQGGSSLRLVLTRVHPRCRGWMGRKAQPRQHRGLRDKLTATAVPRRRSTVPSVDWAAGPKNKPIKPCARQTGNL